VSFQAAWFGRCRRKGGAALRNGELLRRAEGNFDVLVTADRRMPLQQSLTGYSIGVVVIITPRLWYRTLLTAVADVRDAVASVQPGEIRHVKVSA
jgi:hypothetical protein